MHRLLSEVELPDGFILRKLDAEGEQVRRMMKKSGITKTPALKIEGGGILQGLPTKEQLVEFLYPYIKQ